MADNLPAKAETTALASYDDAEMAAMLGIDTSIAETDAAIVAAEPVFQRAFKQDFAGKTRMTDNRMGQFQPIAPGETRAKTLVDTVIMLPFSTKFWPQKSEQVMVQKDGKEVQQTKTVCEGAKRPVLDENNKAIVDSDGNIIWMKDAKGEDVGYATEPAFGHQRSIERYDFYGTKFGRCQECPYRKDGGDGTCKMRGSVTGANVKYDGQDTDPRVAEYTLNYTSTINWAKMLSDLQKRKAEFPSTRPQDIVIEVALQSNDMGQVPFWEMDFKPVMSQSKIPADRLATVKGRALEQYKNDREAALKARADKAAGTTQVAAPAAAPALTTGEDGVPVF